jgi:hypothetical protein
MFGAPPAIYWHSRQWHCAFGEVTHRAAIATAVELHRKCFPVCTIANTIEAAGEGGLFFEVRRPAITSRERSGNNRRGTK